MVNRTVVLGSRSPRRRELLGLLWPAERIEICPPLDSREEGFEGLSSWLEIARQLEEIARAKNDDVCTQLGERGGVSFPVITNSADNRGADAAPLASTSSSGERSPSLVRRVSEAPPLPVSDSSLTLRVSEAPLVLTADTVIVANRADGTYQVLGQPPEDESWREVVRGWFCELYAGRSHIAATAVCLTDTRDGRRVERLVQSHVWVRDDAESLIDWYLNTSEPLGKAGGYALQGLGSVFVTRVEGSISNVVGLPLEVLLEMSEVL